MFSNKRKEIIEKEFNQLIPFMKDKEREIIQGLRQCSEEEALAVKYLYTSMPLSDIASYSFELFRNFATHGVYLWHNGQYSSRIPEDIFLNYVLHHRINEEEISDSAKFFYEKLNKRVKGLSMKEAVIETNYWCAEEATYQAADDRTVSPMTVYNSGIGRCGEESTFMVAALRSIGIPARQVYAPKWSHCDDNHAWVEAWCDGEWVFCGACEPEEILNRGWFTNASSRAMIVHSRWFSSIEPEEDVIEYEGGVKVLNQTKRYALTDRLKITVVDKDGLPVEGAKVDLEVLNYSELFPIVSTMTDKNGQVELDIGLGSIHINVSKDSYVTGKTINVKEEKEYILKLDNKETLDSWNDFDMIAPEDSPVNNNQPTEEEKAKGASKFKKASEKRLAKVAKFENKYKAGANIKEIQKFLEDSSTDKLVELKHSLLNVLTEKDYRDCKADVLKEHLEYVRDYQDKYPDDIFTKYLLNPRIFNEPITKYRKYINDYFSQDQKADFREKPSLIWNYISDTIDTHESMEFPALTSSPVGALKLKSANNLSKKILFVAISRSIGVAARINYVDLSLEYYDGNNFVQLDSHNKSRLTIKSDGQETWTYFQNWSIAKLANGNYRSLDLTSKEWESGKLKLDLDEGQYRILTSNRLPNGNIFASSYTFKLEKDDDKEISLFLRDAKLDEMLIKIDIMDFDLKLENGNNIKASKITQDKQNLLIWLEESKEPTEHILNELYDNYEEFNKLKGNIIFIIKDKKALSDPTIARTLKVLPNAQIYYDSFHENVNTLGRRMYVDPDKLPLIIVTKPGLTGVYATSGYNVGTGDMLLRILDM